MCVVEQERARDRVTRAAINQDITEVDLVSGGICHAHPADAHKGANPAKPCLHHHSNLEFAKPLQHDLERSGADRPLGLLARENEVIDVQPFQDR